MEIIVNGKEKEITMIDKKTGCDWAVDFIVGRSGLEKTDGQWVMDEENFSWWEKICSLIEQMDDIVDELSKEESREFQDLYNPDLEQEVNDKIEYLQEKGYSFCLFGCKEEELNEIFSHSTLTKIECLKL